MWALNSAISLCGGATSISDGIFVFVFVCLGQDPIVISIMIISAVCPFCFVSFYTSELLGHYVHKLPIHHDQCPSSIFSPLLLFQGQGLDFLYFFWHVMGTGQPDFENM